MSGSEALLVIFYVLLVLIAGPITITIIVAIIYGIGYVIYHGIKPCCRCCGCECDCYRSWDCESCCCGVCGSLRSKLKYPVYGSTSHSFRRHCVSCGHAHESGIPCRYESKCTVCRHTHHFADKCGDTREVRVDIPKTRTVPVYKKVVKPVVKYNQYSGGGEETYQELVYKDVEEPYWTSEGYKTQTRRVSNIEYKTRPVTKVHYERQETTELVNSDEVDHYEEETYYEHETGYVSCKCTNKITKCHCLSGIAPPP
jgi:hypothetical protein